MHFALGEREAWVVSSVEAYRAIAGSWPNEQDIVWELGAATGAATVLAAEVAGDVFAVEKAHEKLVKLEAATVGKPNVHVLRADVMAEKPSLPTGSRADWLLVDLGGDAPPWRTMDVVERWASALNCRRVVVRSTKLFDMLSAMQAVESITEDAPRRDSPRPSAPGRKAAGTSTAVLRQRVLETASPDVATRLVSALEKSGFRERKRLVQAIVRLGHIAIQPLARLVGNTRAALAARRAAADALGQVVEAGERAYTEVVAKGTIPVEWALARALPAGRRAPQGLGAELAAADRERGMAPAESVFQMLTHEDEFVRFIARGHLRKGGSAAARALTGELAAMKAPMSATVAALDALSTRLGASPEQVAKWALGAVDHQQYVDVCRVLACASLGVADQKWAVSLLSTIGDLPETREGGVPVKQLRALHTRAQREPLDPELEKLVDEILDAGLAADDLAAAAAASPHPWMRHVGESIAPTT